MKNIGPRKKPKQSRSQETVNTIIEATTRILNEGEMEKLTTNHVAKVAGVSIGSLYQYFPNKESLIIAVHERYFEKMYRLLETHVDDLLELSLEDGIRLYVREILRSHASQPRLYQSLIELMRHIDLEFLKQTHLRIQEFLEQLLTFHQEQIIPKNHKMAAFLLVSSVESILQRGLLFDPEMVKTEEFAEELSLFIIRYLKSSE